MTRLFVAPIVEGHGEEQCVRILIDRVWREIVGGEYVEVLRPIRAKRQKLVHPEEMRRSVELALAKLGNLDAACQPRLVLVLLDADRDPPCQLGPMLLESARNNRSDIDVACVVANVEYETWFVAAAESLGEFVNPGNKAIPEDPERQRAGKGWIAEHFRGTRYSETQDQPRMTQRMDLVLCRKRSPSFDKFCRELERRLVLPRRG